MNRQQRRHPARSFGVPAPQKEVRVTTEYLHSETHVIMRFSQSLNYLQMTPKEVDENIAALQGTKAALLAHQAGKVDG